MKDRNLKNHDNWETPKDFYEKLDQQFHFDFDPCPLNPTFDGLQIDWKSSNFVNPPYSRKLKEAFVNKGIEEFKKGKLCVFLLPVSTSTKLFHEVILPNVSYVYFVKGRLKFKGINTQGEYVDSKCGMHDSMICVFDPKSKASREIRQWMG